MSASPRASSRGGARERGNRVSGTPPGARREVGKAASQRLLVVARTDPKLVDRPSVCEAATLAGGHCLLWAAFSRASALHSKTVILNSKHGDACLVGAVANDPVLVFLWVLQALSKFLALCNLPFCFFIGAL